MREHATTTHANNNTQAQADARRFGPLCARGYRVSGRDGKGFKATDPASGETIRRLSFKAFDIAVRAAGMTSAARAKLLEKRSTPEHRLRERVANQRLTLLEMERREVCPGKRQPRPKPIHTAAPVRRHAGIFRS